nr:MAG TPA: Acid sphingomyelinase-like phosphodiesterase 3b [Bacteriophage sp.]
MFDLIQWSDTHQANTSINAAQAVLKTANGVDAIVHCGDSAFRYFEDGIGALDLNGTLTVIGNHDAFTKNSDGSQNKYKQPTQAQLYNRYMEPLVRQGAECRSATTWWRKKYADKGVVIIGVNDTLNEDALVEEQYSDVKAWLDDAYANGLAVIMLRHSPTAYATVRPCNWTALHAINEESTYISEYRGLYPKTDRVTSLLVATRAKVLCLLHGHDHWDSFQTIDKGDGIIPVIGIGSTYADGWNDVPRSTDSKVKETYVLNHLRYDPTLNTLSVFRLGSDESALGNARKMLVWSYAKNEIVAVCSNRG